MWEKVARLIIKFRLLLIGVIAIVTGVLGYYATKVQMSYDFAGGTVPKNDPDMIALEKFRNEFGEDGNAIGVGFKDSAIYEQRNFKAYRDFARKVKQISGVSEVIAMPLLKLALKDTENSRFYLANIFPETIRSDEEFDSLMTIARNQKVYMEQLVNPKNGATMMFVTVNKDVMNSALREPMTAALQQAAAEFQRATNITPHFAGLPFMRTVVTNQIKREMKIFLLASVLITGLIMFTFFRSSRSVIFSMIIIGIVVVWTMGTLALFGYKITLLTGLLPPVIVTIGITNAIYLLNKYHLEFARTGNKLEAISTVVNKMGLATFLTNLTVAIGFLTLLSTDILMLRQFGIVAGLNIMALFFVSLVMIPSVFSWLPTPTERHLRHLHFKRMGRFLKLVDNVVANQRTAIYFASISLAVISAYGIWQLRSVTFMVDDVPEDSIVKKDLKFFEANFSGIMPLEVVVEFHTKKRRPILDVQNLRLVEEFETFLDSLPDVSKPISFVRVVKGARQAFYNNNPDRYALPTSNQERNFILRYLKGQSDNTGLLNSFVDSAFSKMRISTFMADIGSVRMDSLVHDTIEPRMKSIFVSHGQDSISSYLTGTTKIFIKGNKFLIANLKESLLLAFLLITLSMAALFASVRMIIISLIPNVLALMITAGIMGYLGIPLKASTALIFSITFGISVDNSIRFLAKYRQEILANNFNIALAVTDSILETGKSIIYTSIVLFAGFIIFAFSDFGGTIALGILTSTTLVISMFTNLIVLPSLILTFDRPKKQKGEHLLIDEFDATFYGETEDEEIDLSKIRIHNRHSAAE
jgi:predicted RND superfamily exporter protein